MFVREARYFIIVKLFGIRTKAIGNGIENFAAEIDRSTVCQMPAMRKRHPQKRIPRLQGGEIDRGVGL